jgi:formate dehydrogenase subunit gamma
LAATQEWDEALAAALVRDHEHLPGAMLPVLHALVAAFGYIDNRAIPLVADALNLSRAEVVGVVGFYHDFRQSPPGRHVLRVCRAEACQSMGSEALVTHLESRLGIEMGATTADGGLTLEPVYCLGNCALSPAAMLDGRLYGRLSSARLDQLVAGAVS